MNSSDIFFRGVERIASMAGGVEGISSEPKDAPEKEPQGLFVLQIVLALMGLILCCCCYIIG